MRQGPRDQRLKMGQDMGRLFVACLEGSQRSQAPGGRM